MESRQQFEAVEEHITPDGGQHFVHVIKSPILDDDSRPIGVQGIFWDVTAEHVAERLLIERNAQLQELATSERQALEELKHAQAQMLQTAKLAGLGQMVAGVAHEINNPLAFVINNLVVLQRDLEDVYQMLNTYRNLHSTMEAVLPEATSRLNELWLETDIDYA